MDINYQKFTPEQAIGKHLFVLHGTEIQLRNEIKDYIIKSNDFTTEGDLDPVVRIVELGGSSIDLMIVAYADPMGFAAFNEVKENLIFNIMKIVKSNKSEFAYPSTSLYVESMPK